MRRKELKNLAKKIAECEKIIQTSDDEDAVWRAQQKVIELSGCVESLDDMVEIDEMVQDILKNS